MAGGELKDGEGTYHQRCRHSLCPGRDAELLLDARGDEREGFGSHEVERIVEVVEKGSTPSTSRQYTHTQVQHCKDGWYLHAPPVPPPPRLLQCPRNKTCLHLNQRLAIKFTSTPFDPNLLLIREPHPVFSRGQTQRSRSATCRFLSL